MALGQELALLLQLYMLCFQKQVQCLSMSHIDPQASVQTKEGSHAPINKTLRWVVGRGGGGGGVCCGHQGITEMAHL